MLWVNLIPVLLIAAVLLALPALSRPTVPLGVSVPTTRLNEPVVHRSVRRYRIGVLVSGLVVLVVVVLLAPRLAVIADATAPFVLLASAGAVFVWARRPILQAKRAAGWYDGVAVRITAQLTDEPRAPHPPWARPWYAASLAVLVLTAIVGAALYDRQPDPYPTHWDGSGQADAFATRSVLTVFAPLAVMLGVVLFMAVVAAVIARLPARRYSDGDPDGAELRRAAVQQSLQSGLGLLTLVVTIGAAALQIVIWSGVTGDALAAAGIGFTVLVAAAVLALLGRFARASSTGRTGPSTGRARAAESPDDDVFWKAGLFYVNPDDPALMVPKRIGVGWTINLGRPGGVAIAVLTLILVAVLIGLSALHH